MRHRPYAFADRALLILACLAVSGCATYSGDAPIIENGPAAPAGAAVALQAPVMAGDLVMTAMEVIEDSRCPITAVCVWAGRVVVTTRIDGPGWRETVNLIAGEDQALRGHHVVLYEVMPSRQGDAAPDAGDYRFKFDAKDMKPIMQ